MKQLQAAGYSAEGGVMRNADGVPLTVQIMLSKGSRLDVGGSEKIADLYVQALTRLGITAQVEVVDNAQITKRLETFDFDMTTFRRALSLSPGTEQRYYWGSEAADVPGSGNLMGVKSPAIDAMIDRMLTARGADDFTYAVRALDRLLTTGRYVIPFWQFNEGLIAHKVEMKYPDKIPLYGDGPNFMPEVWWWDDAR
jgi:peptide/nickel transport system substrate-binding protein